MYASGDQVFKGTPRQLLTGITEDLFSLLVGQDNVALLVNEDYGVWHSVEKAAEHGFCLLLSRPLWRSLVLLSHMAFPELAPFYYLSRFPAKAREGQGASGEADRRHSGRLSSKL